VPETTVVHAMQKKGEFFCKFNDCDSKDKIVLHKYSVCWIVVAQARQLIYSGDKDW
jgi:hypothetical protein